MSRPADHDPLRLAALADTLLADRKVEEARRVYARALACGMPPDRSIPERWTAAMLLGDFEAAWTIGDAVLAARRASGERCTHLPRHRRWLWDGSPVDGRPVRVRCYHGLGDTLQFVRFVPALACRAQGVTVEAQAALLPLLASLPGIDRLTVLADDEAQATPDEVEIESTELAHVLRVHLGSLPARVPYLHVPEAFVAAKRRDLRRPGTLAVGLVWSGGEWDDRRKLPLPLLGGLGRVPGVTWHCLQRGPAAADLAGGPPFVDADHRSMDVLDTAAAILALDLVISIDTMVAHLAGALGAPVWTLLHAAADWRWMAGRADSPWYPTMRLFRQPTPGDWPAVVDAVGQALARLAAGSGAA